MIVVSWLLIAVQRVYDAPGKTRSSARAATRGQAQKVAIPEGNSSLTLCESKSRFAHAAVAWRLPFATCRWITRRNHEVQLVCARNARAGSVCRRVISP